MDQLLRDYTGQISGCTQYAAQGPGGNNIQEFSKATSSIACSDAEAHVREQARGGG